MLRIPTSHARQKLGPTLTDTEGVRGSLFSGAFLPKVLGSRGTKLGSNLGGIIVSLKRGTTLGSNSGEVRFSQKRDTTLGSNSGGVIFSPKSPGLSQRVPS